MNNNETNKIISKFTVLDHEFGSDNGWIPKVKSVEIYKFGVDAGMFRIIV